MFERKKSTVCKEKSCCITISVIPLSIDLAPASLELVCLHTFGRFATSAFFIFLIFLLLSATMGRRTRPLHATLAVSSVILSICNSPVPVSSFIDCSLAPSVPRFSPPLSLALAVPRDTADDGVEDTSFYFIREADFADLGSSARILTDGFYGDTNFITYNIERLNTFLSLESTFPQPGSISGAVHSMLVACRQTDGKVLGFAEIDGRPTKDENAAPRPYMCNLAICPKWRRKGIAKALVQQSEDKAVQWGKTEMYLKVREANNAAINMYKSLGYEVQSIKTEAMRGKPPQSVLLMKKELMPQTTENATSEETLHAEESTIL